MKDKTVLLRTYDRPAALFYLDPPYVETEKYYENPFTSADHQRLHDALAKIKGKFILSYNDDPMIRKLYAEYRIEGISRKNTLSGNTNSQDFAELIIRNF